MNNSNGLLFFRSYWRHILLGLSVIGPLALMFSRAPIHQAQEYYDFADRRPFLGIPNFFDVATNLAFLFVGGSGLHFCIKNRWEGMRPAWMILFAGLVSVSLGSGYFHWNPCDATLVWDRLPMTVGFMGLFVAILGEYVNIRLGRRLLVPALLLGAASVFHWQCFDDLRFYFWIQFMPLLAIPVVMALFRSHYSHQGFLFFTLGCYVLAKLAEARDEQIFMLTNRLFSGHSLKHLLAALGCFAIVLMLKKRRATAI